MPTPARAVSAMRQLTLSTGKSAGRNSSGRITLFHRGGGAKRLQRIIDLKRSTSSMGIVERIEYDPNRSTRIALVRWKGVAHQGKCKTIEEFTPPEKRLTTSTATTIRGPFAFSSMPSWWKSHSTSKKACTSDVLFSAFSSPKAKGASLSFGSSFSFPRIAVAGALPAFFGFRRSEQVRGKNTFSDCEIRKPRTNSILWAHRLKRKAALSWQSRKDLLGLVGASEHSKSKLKTDQGQLHSAKAIDEGPKNGTRKVDRAPITYILAGHRLEVGQMVMNWSKP